MIDEPGYKKYDYSTSHKQSFMYRFKPIAPRAFARALDLAVETRVGIEPGKYTVVVDKPVRITITSPDLEVYLQIKRNNELSAERLKVHGWCYA